MSSDSGESEYMQTTVDKHQADEWIAEAEERGITQSAYIRYMVQAGRRDLKLVDGTTDDNDSPPIERLILNALDDGPKSFDGILDYVADKLDDELPRLQDEGKVNHQPRDGTYARK